tara:strand:- start:689 stop:964 length:276 start_codon:yes stop_codon:yes gene_type:complete
MNINVKTLKENKIHVITALTAASAAMSQISEVAIYAPILTTVACLCSAASLPDLLKKADDVVDALEDAGLIDEEVADAVENVIDAVDGDNS